MTPNEIIRALEKSDFIQRYENHQIGLVTRGLVRIQMTFPDRAHYFFADFDKDDSTSLRITKTGSAIDDFFYKYFTTTNVKEKYDLRKANLVLQDFSEYNIISYLNRRGIVRMHTDVPCSCTPPSHYVLFYFETQKRSLDLFMSHDLIFKPIDVGEHWSYSASAVYNEYLE